ncbi:MAG TPA: hypothetical protein P5295_01430, partial [Spirochaetota bacterium]|nr:hypothetical protein [Spirochaetota bacterium]
MFVVETQEFAIYKIQPPKPVARDTMREGNIYRPAAEYHPSRFHPPIRKKIAFTRRLWYIYHHAIS